ncbi:exported hypothetical protein [Candidatus Sulfopaludibacter sp. SbA4]|nr:exported hypothetical protein [Candidatus Sulfopaludibacter sp. SbA4]
MTKLLVVAAILMAASAGIAPGQGTPTPGKDGWVSMFDGKTLDGWKANEHPESWKVVDGAITGDGPASHLLKAGRWWTGPSRETVRPAISSGWLASATTANSAPR